MNNELSRYTKLSFGLLSKVEENSSIKWADGRNPKYHADYLENLSTRAKIGIALVLDVQKDGLTFMFMHHAPKQNIYKRCDGEEFVMFCSSFKPPNN